MNAIARRTLGRYFHTFRFLAKLATGYIARFQVSGQLDIAGETLGSELSSCQDIMLNGRNGGEGPGRRGGAAHWLTKWGRNGTVGASGTRKRSPR